MDKMQEKHYEELFNRLLERGMTLHKSNKRRIRIGLIFLVVFTIGMIVVRYITESDRATFLIIWVIGMFAASIYLIGIEYIDNSIEMTLEEVTERESGWDELLPDSEAVRGLVQGRIEAGRGEMEERMNEKWASLHERYNQNKKPAEDGGEEDS